MTSVVRFPAAARTGWNIGGNIREVLVAAGEAVEATTDSTAVGVSLIVVVAMVVVVGVVVREDEVAVEELVVETVEEAEAVSRLRVVLAACRVVVACRCRLLSVKVEVGYRFQPVKMSTEIATCCGVQEGADCRRTSIHRVDV